MLYIAQRGPESAPHLVFELTIDRLVKRNAVDETTLRMLGDAIEHAVAAEARVVVLTGAGSHFSAGADLGGVDDTLFTTSLRRALALLVEAPLVTVAAVDGVALGAGLQMASFCDLRVATPTARFGVPAAKLGIVVDQATVARLVELVGGGAARSILLAAETVDAPTALALGLVQRIGTLDDALVWANEIAVLAPLSIQGHKLALQAVSESIRGESGASASAAMRRAWASADLREGRTAFLERRQPQFHGR